MVVTTCPSCSQDLEIEAKYIGKGILCPYCKKLFVPPLPHSGFGVTACFLGAVAIILELFVLVYRIVGQNWHASFLPAERLRPAIGFLGFVGIIMTWIGITCAGIAFTQKRRRRDTTKWGLVLSILPNVFCCTYFAIRPWLPVQQSSETPAPETIEAPADTKGTDDEGDKGKDSKTD